MSTVLVVTGGLLIAIALLDVAWTAVAAGSGAGPVTGPVTGALWRLALAYHHRRPSHALLSFAGVAVVFSVLAVWITLVLLGWVLVFTASDGAVRAAHSGTPADLVARVYFVGYSVFTLGNGGFSPGAGTWQIATVLATATGLVLVTLSITYLVPVASAVAQSRQLASYISSLGPTSAEIVRRSWTGSGFGSLSQHFVSLAALIHGTRQHHLTYPVLHYFHSGDRDSAVAPALSHLSGALQLLRHGVPAGARPDPAALDTLDAAIGSYLSTLSSAYIRPGDDSVPPPALGDLRLAGVPTVDDDTFAEATPATRERRRMLAAFLRNDGWPIDERQSQP